MKKSRGPYERRQKKRKALYVGRLRKITIQRNVNAQRKEVQ